MKRSGLALALLFAASLLAAGKLTPQKQFSNLPPKRHPYIQRFDRPAAPAIKGKAANFNKLLVILVDFQEETTDDPNTTGNGKFLLEPDPDYLYTVASPPHNRDYFLQNMEALRYYYLAASVNSYDLQYEVWPQSGAYTLPHAMGYYNPAGVDGDLFVARMEEYFQDAFEIADSLSPEIDFAQYGHFMIIHAGSDWQHDIKGDTPSDIPSFFITVGEGKEAVVDNGAVLISHACNVPSTISQDFDTDVTDSGTYHSGYGALNSVLAHEFGHSLGFVDLYNVYNWQPMVGVFDIMDSGGSGVLVDVLNDGSYVMVEGALPVLPGAWSRSLVFGDDLKSRGYLRDLDQLHLFTPQEISAASSIQAGNTIIPEILRVPLSNGEYILVENRNVDPDGDGGTAVFATDDSRVILYPTPLGDPENHPSFEYDYLLPSFQKADGSAVGGGLLVWRINDSVIYEEGVTDSEGNWISNFYNNSVNTHYASRGVEIIEADNLPDIGYQWSWYWTGTQYEYFHKYKPVLDSHGYFVNWSLQDWKPALSGSTEPALLDSDGLGSLYWLNDIGNPGATMNLTLRSGFFDETQTTHYETSVLPGPLINSSFSDYDIPLLSEDSIRLLSYDGSAWTDLMGVFPWNGSLPDFPITTCDQNGNGFQELALAHGSSLELVEFASDDLQSTSINYPDAITSAPLNLRDTLFVSTFTSLSSVRGNTILGLNQLQSIRRLCSFGPDLAALSSDLLHIIDTATLAIKAEIELPEPFGNYEPVSFTAETPDVRMLFLMSNSGNIYKYQDSLLRKIWQNHSSDRPTQMGITMHSPYYEVAVTPVLFWACGSSIYAVTHDGTLRWGYPYNAFPLEFTAGEHVYALINHPHYYLNLPVAGKGHVAYSPGEGIFWNDSLVANTPVLGSQLATIPTDDVYEDLFWYYADPEGGLNIHRSQFYANGFALIWNGFRNGGDGSSGGHQMYDMQNHEQDFFAYLFPNPVRDSSFRVRIGNFNQELSYAIYDINASLLQSGHIPADGAFVRDVLIDSSKLSSGVYILNVRCGRNSKTMKFAVEK